MDALFLTVICASIGFSLVTSRDGTRISRWLIFERPCKPKEVSNENLGIWRSFIDWIALLGEAYALFQFVLSIAFPLPLQKPLWMQLHVAAPLMASLAVRWMCYKHGKLSYEQIHLLAMILNTCAIINRVDVPKHLLPANFMVRTFIGAFSSCPGRLVTMNFISAPLAYAIEWNSCELQVDLAHAVGNETLCILLMNVIILHLSAIFQKQEMATQKLQEEIRAKSTIVQETQCLLGAARRLLSVTCDSLLQLSHDWKLIPEPSRSVKDMLQLGAETSTLHFAQFIAPEDHDRFSTFIRTSSDSNAPSSLHLKMQDTKGCSFHVQLFHVEIPSLGADHPTEHLLGIQSQELKEPPEGTGTGGCCPIPEGEVHCPSSASSVSSRPTEKKSKDRSRRRDSNDSGPPEGWPKLDSIKLTLDLNTTEMGYAIRSFTVELKENFSEFSFLKFVRQKYRAVVEDWIQEHMQCWMMQSPCDEPCLGCKLRLDGMPGSILVREMRVLRIDQIKEVQEVKDWSDGRAGRKALDYTLLMTLELKNFLGSAV